MKKHFIQPFDSTNHSHLNNTCCNERCFIFERMGGDGDDVEWQMVFGAKVKTPIDMPDDILKDAISVSIQELYQCENLEANGEIMFTFIAIKTVSVSADNSMFHKIPSDT